MWAHAYLMCSIHLMTLWKFTAQEIIFREHNWNDVKPEAARKTANAMVDSHSKSVSEKAPTKCIIIIFKLPIAVIVVLVQVSSIVWFRFLKTNTTFPVHSLHSWLAAIPCWELEFCQDNHCAEKVIRSTIGTIHLFCFVLSHYLWQNWIDRQIFVAFNFPLAVFQQKCRWCMIICMWKTSLGDFATVAMVH